MLFYMGYFLRQVWRWSAARACGVGLLYLGSLPAFAQDAELLARLVRLPLVSSPSLSSDGHYIVALKRGDDGEADLAVWRVEAGLKGAALLPYRRLDLNWMSWIGGGRLLLSTKERGLVLYDAHTQTLRPLIEKGGPRPNELPPVLLSDLPSDPVHILMQWEDPAVPGYPAVYKVNAFSGTSEKSVGAWRPIIRWWASPNGSVKMGEGYEGRKQVLFASDAIEGSWLKVSEKDYFKGPAYGVLAVETGGVTALLLATNGEDKRALWRMDIQSGQLLHRLAASPRYDMDAALFDPVTDIAIGASYVADEATVIIWQGAWRRQIASLKEKLGARNLTLVIASRDGRRLLLRSRAPYRPVLYYLYDVEEDKVYPLAKDPGLETLPKPDSHGVWIPVKGMKDDMHAILSQPQTASDGKAVVLVHGGPVNRASIRFQPLVSWLVANGYSVLQPNFRGSAGYGEIWRQAGYGEWGRRMQEDVRFAAEWMVTEGIAKAGDMCVMGGSYGGYAALLSAIKDEDLFACAISLNGVSSLPHLVDYLSQNRFSQLTVPRIKVGLSTTTLARRSPLYRAGQVRLPILLLHATQDTNVPFYHSLMMANALADKKKRYDFIVIDGAEHVLRRAHDRSLYLSKSTTFLDRYLRGAKQK